MILSAVRNDNGIYLTLAIVIEDYTVYLVSYILNKYKCIGTRKVAST